jgi:hypothetical protein
MTRPRAAMSACRAANRRARTESTPARRSAMGLRTVELVGALLTSSAPTAAAIDLPLP